MTKTTKPTEDQIKVEIALLTEMQPKVRRWTGFGEDNHQAIAVQIDVLTDRLDDEDDIYDRYGEDAFIDQDEFDQRDLDMALQACQWLNGESDEGSPSEGWKDLVQE